MIDGCPANHAVSPLISLRYRMASGWIWCFGTIAYKNGYLFRHFLTTPLPFLEYRKHHSKHDSNFSYQSFFSFTYHDNTANTFMQITKERILASVPTLGINCVIISVALSEKDAFMKTLILSDNAPKKTVMT